MIPKQQRLVYSSLLVEFGLLNISILSIFLLKNFLLFSQPSSFSFLYELLSFIGIFNLVWGLIILVNRDHDFYLFRARTKKVKSFIVSAFMFIGIISTIAIIFKIEYFNRTTFLLPIILFSFLNILSFSLIADIGRRKAKHLIASKVLLIGDATKWKNISLLVDTFRKKGIELIGLIDVKGGKTKIKTMDILGGPDDIENILDQYAIDELYLIGGSIPEKTAKEIIRTADYRGKRINVIPETPMLSGNILKPASLDGIPLFQYRQTPLDDFSNYFLKRVFDVFFSLSVLIILMPLLIIIGLIILSDGKGGVFYMPFRKGEAGNVFKCYKFRTMSACDDPVNGTKSTVQNDPRITKIGKYLRKFDLDELPQFFNVLKGDMSVVGPRPHRVNLDLDFRKIVNDYMVRHYVKPGITGWAQVNGWRGPTTTVKQKKKRVWHDLWYIENWNFLLDIKIIFLTVFSRKTRRNAF